MEGWHLLQYSSGQTLKVSIDAQTSRLRKPGGVPKLQADQMTVLVMQR